MAAVLKHWREAATLIIIAPSRLHPSTFTQSQKTNSINNPTPNHKLDEKDKKIHKFANSEYETLLLKRSGKSKFMPNMYVFPGGTALNTDFSSEWLQVFQTLGQDLQQSLFDKVSKGSSKASPMFTRDRDPEHSIIPPEVAFRICAIRETFEESGVLIVKKAHDVIKDQNQIRSILDQNWNSCSTLPSDDPQLMEWRKRVNENPEDFILMCKEMNLVPDISSLYEWTNWLTPTLMGGRRFDTVFYICCMDHKPGAKEDNFETVDNQWITPSSLLAAHNKKSIRLAPPQVYELSRLLRFNESAQLMQFAAEREAERVERFFPVICFAQDSLISLMPGDDLYPKEPDFFTPKKVVQFEETTEELNKRTKNFHRTISPKDRGPNSAPERMIFNLVFKNRHVGPVSLVENEMSSL